MDIDPSLASSASVDGEPKSPTPNEQGIDDEEPISRPSHESGTSTRKSAELRLVETMPGNSTDAGDSPLDTGRPSQDVMSESRDEVLSVRPSGESTRLSFDLPAEARMSDDNSSEAQRQEIYGYIERIDALQTKLKYLAKEAAESARNAAASASPGSVQKQLLEKDEKIALLLEEGQKLSKSEMDHRTVVRKLRQQLTENTKAQTETKKKTEKLERELAASEARAKRAEAAEKRANETLSYQKKTTKDLDAVTNERNSLNQTVQEMKAQLNRALARAEAAESKAESDALEHEKRRANDLEEELSTTKIERDIREEKLKKEISELTHTIEQEKERARMLEAELKSEQSVLESKMETLRSRAEEASSGATGETQAKLLRQIETLQTQYSVASDNWHTLEGSLLSRLSNVERERDDAAKREAELRKKIRELVGFEPLSCAIIHGSSLLILCIESQGQEIRRRCRKRQGVRA